MAERSPRPSVSVLMPCLDGGRFLREALESVLGEPEVLELLVADGGSRDGSLELLRRRAAEDPRLRLVSTSDHGPGDALNRALAQVRGTVIGWLNADDLYHRGAPGRAVQALQAHPRWLLVYGEGEHIDADGAVLDRYPTRPPDVGLAGFRDYCFLCQPTVFWRRSLSVLLGGFDTSLQTCFDFEYWIRAFAAFPERIGHIEVLQGQTRRHAATLSATRLPRAVLEATLLQARLGVSGRPHLVMAYVGEILSGELPLPAGSSPDRARVELLEIAAGLPWPAEQLAAIERELEPLRHAAGPEALQAIPLP